MSLFDAASIIDVARRHGEYVRVQRGRQGYRHGERRHGRAVQVDPMKSMLKPPGKNRSKL
jgi:hypothetical protein